MDGNVFENAPRLDADIFYTNKNDAFSKLSGYVWTRPEYISNDISQYLIEYLTCLIIFRNFLC